MDQEYSSVIKSLSDKKDFDKKWLQFCKKVSSEIEQAVDSDVKLLIIAEDVDSIACSAVMYYLMQCHGKSYSGATAFIKERRISVQPVQTIHKYF